MAKKKKKATTKDFYCLNCKQPFFGKENFCPKCGQKNKGKNLKVNDFIREVFAGFFSWDAKFWRTLFPLLFKPGQVSKEYVEGKRVKFTNPFRFFFIVSIVFFFLAKLNDKYKVSIPNNDNKNIEKTKKDTTSNAIIFKKNIGHFVDFQKKHPKMEVEVALDSLKEESTYINRLFYRKAKTINEFSDDTGGTVNKLIKLSFSYLPTASLLLLPVFAFILKLLYIRRKQNYMNHLIFIFHIATFFFINLTLFQFISLLPFTEKIIESSFFIFISCFMVFGIYPFIAMKIFYKQSNLKTFFKLSLIGISFSSLTIITVSLILALAFFMM